MMTYDGDDPRFICKTVLASFFHFVSRSELNPILLYMTLQLK
jgi:hypothetical protein